MFPPRKILIIDHDVDRGAEIARALQASFPDAAFDLVDELEAAVSALADDTIEAVVLHETRSCDTVALTTHLRELRGDLPLIAVSAHDDDDEAFAAGATAFVRSCDLLGDSVSSARSPSPRRRPPRSSFLAPCVRPCRG